MIRLLLTSILVLSTVAPAAAQQSAEALVGARVRFAVPQYVNGYIIKGTQRPSVGTLVGIDSSWVMVRLESDGTLLSAPFSGIKGFEVSRGTISAAEGRHRGLRHGALMGAGATTAAYGLGYLIGFVAHKLGEENCPFELISCEREPRYGLPHAVPVIIGSTIGGAVLGLALGGREQERWEPVRIRSLRPVTAQNGLVLSMSLDL